METAGGKYPPAKSCVLSLVKGMVEFITQSNEESSEGTDDTSSHGVNCSHHIIVAVITRPIKTALSSFTCGSQWFEVEGRFLTSKSSREGVS